MLYGENPLHNGRQALAKKREGRWIELIKPEIIRSTRKSLIVSFHAH